MQKSCNSRRTPASACCSEMGGYDRLDSKLKAPVPAIWKILKSHTLHVLHVVEVFKHGTMACLEHGPE